MRHGVRQRDSGAVARHVIAKVRFASFCGSGSAYARLPRYMYARADFDGAVRAAAAYARRWQGVRASVRARTFFSFFLHFLPSFIFFLWRRQKQMRRGYAVMRVPFIFSFAIFFDIC